MVVDSLKNGGGLFEVCALPRGSNMPDSAALSNLDFANMDPAWLNLDSANMDWILQNQEAELDRRARRQQLKADIDEAKESFARTMAIHEKEDAELAIALGGLNFDEFDLEPCSFQVRITYIISGLINSFIKPLNIWYRSPIVPMWMRR
jgi:hypothetical protein